MPSNQKDFEAWWEKAEGQKLTRAQKEFLANWGYEHLSHQHKALAIRQAEALGDL